MGCLGPVFLVQRGSAGVVVPSPGIFSAFILVMLLGFPCLSPPHPCHTPPAALHCWLSLCPLGTGIQPWSSGVAGAGRSSFQGVMSEGEAGNCGWPKTEALSPALLSGPGMKML